MHLYFLAFLFSAGFMIVQNEEKKKKKKEAYLQEWLQS